MFTFEIFWDIIYVLFYNQYMDNIYNPEDYVFCNVSYVIIKIKLANFYALNWSPIIYLKICIKIFNYGNKIIVMQFL